MGRDLETGKESIGRYEELRARALGQGDRSEGGLGWALFVRKGMVEWLRARQEHGPQSAPECGEVGARRLIPAPEQHNEMVNVWTTMVLSQITERTIGT